MLNGRYELREELGQGGSSRTFAATDTTTRQPVVVKELQFANLRGWKPFEHFEREAKVLASLSHPNIPKFIDAFQSEDDEQLRLYIVSEYVPGPNLAQAIEQGQRWTPERAKTLAASLLEILDYLHTLAPPVIHRDIKPGNIIVRPDDRVALIDFGAVRALAIQEQPGTATVLGTPGYMAPEQALGVASPSCDLYSLGMTLAHSLTHVHPSELPREGMRVRFEQFPGLAPEIAKLLAGLCEADPERRYPDARTALDQLRAPPEEVAPQALAPHGAGALANITAAPRSPAPAVEKRLTKGQLAMKRRIGLSSLGALSALIIGANHLGVLASPLPLLVAAPLILIGAELFARRRVQRLYRVGTATIGKVQGARQGQSGSFVRYAYDVDGTHHTGQSYFNDALALARLEPGSELIVYYDPEHPERSVADLQLG